jgi:hypothetical protein
MQKIKTSTENQLVLLPSSFHHHIIGLTRSLMLECFLYTSCTNKHQNSETDRKTREKRLVDRICRLCRGTQQTQTPMPLCSTSKPRRLASKRTPRSSITATTASLTGTDLFLLEGEISNIDQPVGHPHREYNTITTPKTCQYNQASRAVVKTVHSFLWVLGSTHRH